MRKINRISTGLIAMVAMFAMSAPAFALANYSVTGVKSSGHDNERSGKITAQAQLKNSHKEDREDNDGDKDDSNHQSNLNQFGVKVFDKNGKGFGRGGFISSMFYSGTVTSISSAGFTIQTKDNQFFNVDTANAKLIRLPRTVIALGDIAVGDMANVTGTKSGVTITASVVYDLSVNLKPATAKGEVTAVNGNNLTVQVAGATQPLQVKTDADTQVVKADKTSGSLTDVTTNSAVKLVGFWDSVLNVFNAIKIKLF